MNKKKNMLIIELLHALTLAWDYSKRPNAMSIELSKRSAEELIDATFGGNPDDSYSVFDAKTGNRWIMMDGYRIEIEVKDE